MIKLRQQGSFSNTFKYLEKVRHAVRRGILDKYGQKGVAALASATPVDTGLTASSWYYEVSMSSQRYVLSFWNSNVQNGVPIAIILQYGHGTGTGGWVEGRDYINPAIRPIFDELATEVWKEVTEL